LPTCENTLNWELLFVTATPTSLLYEYPLGMVGEVLEREAGPASVVPL
jgi:hypothetical protein